LAEEDIVVSVVGDTSGLEKSLENVAKQIAKFSRTTTTALENLNDSLLVVADAAKGMGTGIAAGAKQGTQELKKLEDQAARTAKNISASTGKPLTMFGPKVEELIPQAKNVKLTRFGSRADEAEKRVTAELQKQRGIEAERAQRIKEIVALKQEEAAKQNAALQLDKQRQRALKEMADEQRRLEKLQSEEIKKLAIARTLRLGDTFKDEGSNRKRFVADISQVTPAIQQAVAELPRLRYALFDVSRGFAIAGAAAIALGAAPLGLAVKYQREFADVQRTTGLGGDALEALRQDFIKLKQDVPISWKELTDIGSLAGQLGIAGNLIADFTASVARFAATTDLNVEQTATLFGRLNQLIDGVDGQFEKLSSAINRVGVISVATESQIGAVAQNIASIANLSGFAASEVIGLAGALASLGIAPELARGTVTRLFSNINKSIALGGRNLEEFGRLTDTTASGFAEAWDAAPADALIRFFEGIDREGGRAERTLRELGVTSVRDVPAILRLAQNSELVAKLVRESANAFEEGTESIRQYNTITATISERVKLLGQNFELLAATSGESVRSLGPLIDLANDLVRSLIKVVNVPFNQNFLGLAAILSIVVGAFLLLISAIALVGAKSAGAISAIVGLNTALFGAETASKRAGVGMFAFLKSLAATNVAAKVLVNTLRGFAVFAAISAVLAVVSAATERYRKANQDAAAAARDAFGEISSFTEAVAADTAAYEDGARVIAIRTTKLERDADAIDNARKQTLNWVDAAGEAERAARNLNNAIDEQITVFDEQALAAAKSKALEAAGDPENVFGKAITAIANDPGVSAALESFGFDFEQLIKKSFEGKGAEYAAGFINELAAELKKNEARLSELTAQASLATPLSPEQIEEYKALTAITEEQVRVLGVLRTNLPTIGKEYDNLADAAVEVQRIQDLVNGKLDDQAKLASLTGDAINELIEDIFGAANATAKTEAALSRLGDSFREVGEDALGASKEIQDTIVAILEEFPDPSQAVNELVGLFQYLASVGVDVTSPAMAFLTDTIFTLGLQAGLTRKEIGDLIAVMGSVPVVTNFAEGFNKVGKAAGGAAKKVETFEEKMSKLINTLFEGVNAQQAASDAIFKLGEAFGEIGDEALYAGSEMQSAIKAIVASSSNGEQAVANLSALLGTLSAQSGVSGASLQVLRQVIEEVGRNAGLSAARIAQLVQSAGSGLSTIALNNFSRGIEAANKQVRTLVDYAGDLAKVFSRAFDIRFKSILKMDDIADSWQKLNERIDETTRSLAKLSADQNVKRYFLSIAEAYGDTLRADVIRAELADIEKEIKKAQDSLSREVVGDSTAARENRRVITGLVAEYQDYIASLAESGASQEELRQAVDRARRDFEEQARQLGFSEQVIQQYGAAFDDVRIAIDRVPRNITVDANVNPALQALNELNAALERNIQSARVLNNELRAPAPPLAPKGPVEPVKIPITLVPATPNQGQNINQTIRRIQVATAPIPGALQWRPFASGGFTGRGGKFDPAGIVHRGEYVIPKQFVNQSTGMPDPAFLAQLQNGMRSFANGGFVGPASQQSGVMMVELSPYDRKLLADAGNVQLRLNGRVVAEATNANNFNEARRGSN
jgi:TP901 family phage tail tape measure protein